jgi:hypothetical protein
MADVLNVPAVADARVADGFVCIATLIHPSA